MKLTLPVFTTRRNITKGGIILMIGLITLLIGCQPATRTADLHICLEHYQSSRAITPDDPLSVDSYQVNGSGPDGTSFSITTDDTQFTVTGLLTGDWDVSAVGFSSEGVGLVQGEAVITLSNSNSTGQVSMEEFYGMGSAEVTVTWDDTQTISPEVKSYLMLCGSSEQPEELTAITTADGSATYELEDLEAGAYLFMSELYSESIQVAGAVEIIRIVDALTTTGTVAFKFDDLLIDLGSTIIDDSAAPITGAISGIPMTVTANQPIEVTFIPSAESLQTGLNCTWYLDGQYLNQGNPVTIVPPEGKHRIDAVITASNLGSTGSVHKDINAVAEVATGTPLLFKEYEDGEQADLLLDGISDIEVLPDGLIITVSKYSDSLQTMNIVNDELIEEQTFSLDDFNFLDGVSMVTSSKDGAYIAAASDNSKTVTIYDHTASSDTITRLQTLLQDGINGEMTYHFGQISGIALNSDGSSLYISDKSTDTIIVFTRSGSVFTLKGNYTFSTDPAIETIRSIACGYDDEIIPIASYTTNSLHAASVESDGSLTMAYSFNYSNSGFYGLTGVNQVFFPENSTFFTLGSDTICEYHLTDSAFGIPEIAQRSRLKQDTHIPVPFSPKDVCANGNVSKLYAVTSTGKGIVCIDNTMSTHEMSYDSFMSTDLLTPDSCAISIDDQYLLVGSSVDDTLQLYKFAL